MRMALTINVRFVISTSNAWQIKRKKKKKCGGEGEGNYYKLSLLGIERGGECFIMFGKVSSKPS